MKFVKDSAGLVHAVQEKHDMLPGRDYNMPVCRSRAAWTALLDGLVMKGPATCFECLAR